MAGKAATPQETYDHIFGSGALSYEWWLDVALSGIRADGTAHNEWRVLVTADDGDGGTKAVQVTHRLVMKTARRVFVDRGKTIRTPRGTEYPAWSKSLERACTDLLFNADQADLDADVADELLQLVVLSEVVFG